MMTFALDQFSDVGDFVVRLTDAGEGDLHIEFASRSRGRLAGFPAWEHADRDLRHFIPADVPFGTFAEPYEDRDEGWRIVIFEDAGWIYIAEADEVNATDFARTIRVKRDTYFEAWAALIDQFNPITVLDEEEE
ncbi:MAG: hypothetical protein M3Q69_10460 [Acidobacteriota bacterium]|nr:hypothetical protein [Acidobacteriota bacterium]